MTNVNNSYLLILHILSLIGILNIVLFAVSHWHGFNVKNKFLANMTHPNEFNNNADDISSKITSTIKKFKDRLKSGSKAKLSPIDGHALYLAYSIELEKAINELLDVIEKMSTPITLPHGVRRMIYVNSMDTIKILGEAKDLSSRNLTKRPEAKSVIDSNEESLAIINKFLKSFKDKINGASK